MVPLSGDTKLVNHAALKKDPPRLRKAMGKPADRIAAALGVADLDEVPNDQLITR